MFPCPFRTGNHSASEDSSEYRSVEEVNYWKEQDNPITRLRHFMINVGWWDEIAEKEWVLDAKNRVSHLIAASLHWLYSCVLVVWIQAFEKLFVQRPVCTV